MTYRIRNVLIAVGLALVALLLTLLYVTNVRRTAQQQSISTAVYVATRDLSAGMAGSDLVSQNALKLVQVPRRDVVPGAISNPDQISRLVLSTSVYQGEEISLRRFTNVAAQGIRAQLKGTLRAVEIPGTPDQLLLGTLAAGDHVDLVANVRINPNTTQTATRVVLRNLDVLTGPTDGALTKLSSPGSQSYAIVAVNDTQVQRLFWVLKNADWTFELRPVVGATDSPERLETIHSILSEGMHGKGATG
jgi:Flp pilus assembly protein CpaB